MSKFKIITFDGGGVRTILSLIILKRIHLRLPDFIESTDLFAGTSAGSIIALALAKGIDPEYLCTMYSMKNIKYIFSAKCFGLNRPLYSNIRLYKMLSKIFPRGLALGDLKHHILVPSFNLGDSERSHWGTVYFNNFPDSKTLNTMAIDAAMCSCACPIYFPSYKNHIDGGVSINNPSSIALAFAANKFSECGSIDNMCLLSFGSGHRTYKINTDTSNWGVWQWTLNLSPPPLSPLLSIVSDGLVDTNYQTTKLLLKDNCFRINPGLHHQISVDQYIKIPILKKIAYSYDIEPAVKWLEENWI